MGLRSVIGLADLADAFYWLRPSGATIERVAAALGLKLRHHEEPAENFADETSYDSGKKGKSIKLDPGQDADRLSNIPRSDGSWIRGAFAGHKTVELECVEHRLQSASLPDSVANAPSIPRWSAGLPPKIPLHPLIPRHLARSFLWEMLAQPLPSDEIDFEPIVEQLAMGSVPALTRVRRKGLRNGVQVLIDDGPGMEPFRLDIQNLLERVHKVVGPNCLGYQFFERLPLQSAECKSSARRGSYRLPSSGTTVLLITDLGIGQHAASWRASQEDWGSFIHRLVALGCRIIALVPYGRHRWPNVPHTGFRAVFWGTAGLDENPAELLDFARILAPAAMLDRSLIREARRECFPRADPGLEADLLFSHLVAVWNSRVISLRDDTLVELRNQLRSRPVERAKAIGFLLKYRAQSGTTDRLHFEETLVSLILESSIQDVDRLLSSLVRAVIAKDQDIGIARWACSLANKLPVDICERPACQQLQLAACLRLGIPPDDLDQLSVKDSWLLPEDTKMEVAWAEGSLVVREPPVGDTYTINVPSTIPRYILLESATSNTKRLQIWPGQNDCIIDTGLPITLRTLSGSHYSVRHKRTSNAKTKSKPLGALERSSTVITPDGTRVLSTSDESVRVWDATSGRELIKLVGHTNKIWAVIALGGSSRALSGGADKTLRLWDLGTGECLKTIECGPDGADAVCSIAVDLAEARALSGHGNGRVRLWDLEAGRCLATLTGHSGDVNSVHITPDGRFAISGSDDTTVKVWNLEMGICVGTLEGHQNSVDSVAISPDGALIASAGFLDRSVRLWDWKSGACLQVIEPELSRPISVAFSPDASRLLIGAAEPPNIYVYRLTATRAAQLAEATRRYVNAKVVLIGEGTVGKTSLAHRLIEDRYVIRDRTHGMNVWPLDLPLPPDATMQREALLWDLPGQEDYRLIHRLFLRGNRVGTAIDQSAEGRSLCRGGRLASGPGDCREPSRAGTARTPPADFLPDRCRWDEDR